MNCPKCGETLYPKQSTASVSLGGILGALVFIAGVVLLLASPVTGLVTIIVGILIGMAGRSKRTDLVCPACRYSQRL